MHRNIYNNILNKLNSFKNIKSPFKGIRNNTKLIINPMGFDNLEISKNRMHGLLRRGIEIRRLIDDKDTPIVSYFFINNDYTSFICSNLPNYREVNPELKIDYYEINEIQSINSYRYFPTRLSIVTNNYDILLFEVDTALVARLLKKKLNIFIQREKSIPTSVRI